MNLLDAFTNPVLIVPIVSWLIAQVFKITINSLMNKRVVVERLFGDGGMPSAHSATVTSLAFMCGISSGFDSVIFAVAAVLAVVVMHDATGVRRETGKQAVAIVGMLQVINEYIVEKDKTIKSEKLKTLVGHTPLQVFAGAVLGIVICLVFYFIWGVNIYG